MTLSAADVRSFFRRVERAYFERWPENVVNRTAHVRQEWRRSRARRDPFINSAAYSRVLDALSREATSELAARWLRGRAPARPDRVETAARIITLLLWIKAHRSPFHAALSSARQSILEERGIAVGRCEGLLDKHHPAEVMPGRTDYLERRQLQIEIEALREASPTAGETQLQTASSHLVDPVEHLWAEPLVRSRAKVGKRGRAAADRASAWRGVFVRALDALVPERCDHRNSTIAELLRLTGDNEIKRRHVARILRPE